MAIDWARLRAHIVGVAVGSVNNQLYIGLARAERDVPVRKVFRGGRQTVRFKTATEIEADKALRSRLGLAPEILATPEGIARVRGAGRNPKRSTLIGGKEFGFARVVTRADRVNSWSETGGMIETDASGRRILYRGARVLDRTERNLKEREYESYLSGAGRYELKSGRAASQRQFSYGELVVEKGAIKGVKTVTQGIGPVTLGGGLRRTLRVIEARADTYPVIKGWLVAGDAEHDYAKYQELGTRHNPAHPFLRPRLPEWKTGLPAQLGRDMRRRAGR